MKFLYLIPYNPVPPIFGGAIRIYNILRHLVDMHDVTVAGFGDPHEKEAMETAFPSLKGKVHFLKQPYNKHRGLRRLTLLSSLFSSHSNWYNMTMTEEMEQLLIRLTEEHDFDAIQSEFPVMANYDIPSRAIKIYDAHNVEYNNFRRMSEASQDYLKKLYYWLESKKFYREEVKAVGRQDSILVTNQRDANIYSRDIADVPKYIVPNGVDMEYFKPSHQSVEPHSLVYVGMMKYLPNDDAMSFFLQDIFPKIAKRVPNIKLYIVGSNPSQYLMNLNDPRVEVTGFVEDVRPYVNRSSVYVVPLRMGGGTRLKIIEAMAMRKPIVTTSIGCEGLGMKNGETALIADEIDQFADSVVELIHNQPLANYLIDNAYELVKDNYSWEVVYHQLEDAYQKIFGEQYLSNFREVNFKKIRTF